MPEHLFKNNFFTEYLRETVSDCSMFYFSWSPIVDYIDHQYEAYLKDESGLNRRNISDGRVHCCLYFVNPAGHG